LAQKYTAVFTSSFYAVHFLPVNWQQEASMTLTGSTPNEIRSIFEDVCAKRGPAFLGSQSRKLEGNFVYLDGNEVHARTLYGGEDILCVLQADGLSLRFPHKQSFVEANAKLIGLGLHEGSKTIRFALPTDITNTVGRKSPRVTGLDKSHAISIHIKDGSLIRFGLADLSVTGARLTLPENVPSSEFGVEERIVLSVFVADGISFKTEAIIRHIGYMYIAVEFAPGLPETVLRPLSKWINKKLEEGKPSAILLDEIKRVSKDDPIEGGILLITGHDEIDSELQNLLGNVRRFHRVMPEIGLLKKEIPQKKPSLVILHLADGSMDEIRLWHSIVETIPTDLPTLLLGTNIKFETLFELGVGWEVSSSIYWMQEKGPFLKRLVLGILRSRYGQSEKLERAPLRHALAAV
jgi:hypothetical protein